MHSRTNIPLALLALVALSLPVAAQEEKLEFLLKHSPALPNTMGYVNVESLHGLMKDAGMHPQVVEHVGEYWFVADLDVGMVRPKWEAGYATVRQPIEAAKLADRLGGYVDEVGDRQVIWSPGQTYLVPGEDNRLGVLRPADRSLLTQWLNRQRSYQSSRYLESQSKPPEQYLSLMLAIDLEGVFSPVPMAQKLADLSSLKSQSADTVSGILASVEGVSVLIGRRGLNECIVRASFAKSPVSLEPIAADLFAELMERGGTAAPEIRTWKVSTEDNTISLQGPITEATLSGLMSVFSIESKAGQTIRLSDAESGSAKEQNVAYRTKNYFDEVNEIVERTREHKSQTTGALAKWNDARARQIDELGTLNVDPDMIQYGTDVAELLRGNALTVRQGNIKAGKTKAQQGYSGGYYGYGYNSTVNAQRVTSANARGNAYADYKNAINAIDQLTASVRRAMTDKYQIQF